MLQACKSARGRPAAAARDLGHSGVPHARPQDRRPRRHLRLMAEVPPMAVRLETDMAYIVDEYHSSGHVGKWCSENCMLQLEANKALLDTFPRKFAKP